MQSAEYKTIQTWKKNVAFYVALLLKKMIKHRLRVSFLLLTMLILTSLSVLAQCTK